MKNHYQATAYNPGVDSFSMPYLQDRLSQINQIGGDVRSYMGHAGENTQGQDARSQFLSQLQQERQRQNNAASGFAQTTGMLQMAANGQIPSAAAIQQQQGLEQAVSAQRSAAASAHGMSPALAQHLANQNIASLQQGSVADAARLRAEEQAQARSQLASAQQAFEGMQQQGAAGTLAGYGGLRAADLQGAQLGQQGQQFGLSSLLGIQQLGLSAEQSQADLQARYAQLMAGQNVGIQGINANVASQNYQNAYNEYMLPQQALWGALGSGVGTAAGIGMKAAVA